MLIYFGSSLNAAAEPDEQDILLAQEKMQQLREVYKEIQQAEVELQRLTEEAEREEPLLRPTLEALKKMKAFLQEAGNPQRFQEYLNSSKDRKAAYRLYEHCKVVFSQNKSFELLSDPNQERLIKKPMIHYFRTVIAKDSFTSFTPQFDPTDPNDERLWKNIKRIHFKQAPEEYLQQKREYYVKEKGVPNWLPDYAGNMAFADGMINWYEGGILLLTPQNVREAEKQVKEVYRKIGKIYHRWSKMRHLLADENNPDNEAVIRAVQEHMQIWPTVNRK
jgi:hypothetical protein